MRRVIAGTTAGERACAGRAAATTSRTTASPARAANGERVSNDDAQERRRGSAAAGAAARGTDVQGTFRYVDTERGAPGPFGSRSGEPLRRRRRDLARHDRARRRRRALRAAVVRRRRAACASASSSTSADYDLTFMSAVRPSRQSDTRRAHARVQTDAVPMHGFGVSGGVEWLGERGGSTFITAGTVGRFPSSAACIGIFGEGPLERASSGQRAGGPSRRAHHARGARRRSVGVLAAPTSPKRPSTR